MPTSTGRWRARGGGRPRAALSTPSDALALGVVLSLLSVVLMGLALNWPAAALLALTIAFYVFVYTLWLKRRTPQNIVIGGAAGAFPPMIGWAAVTGDVSVTSVALFLLIFMWTPPHFWALALYRTRDYAKVERADAAGGRRARRDARHILIYTATLLPIALVPVAMGDLGLLYLVAAVGLTGAFVAYAVRLWRDDSDLTAMRTFRFSILYLFALFAAMALDRYWGFSTAG